jgi:hypothetical protein
VAAAGVRNFRRLILGPIAGVILRG